MIVVNASPSVLVLASVLVVLLQFSEVSSTVNDNYESPYAGGKRAPTRRDYLLAHAPLRCGSEEENIKGKCRLRLNTDYGDYGEARRRAGEGRSSRGGRCPPGQILINNVCEDKTINDCELCRNFIANIVKHLCPEGQVFVQDGCVRESALRGRYNKKKNLRLQKEAFTEDIGIDSDSLEETSIYKH